MVELSTEFPAAEVPQSCLEVIRDALEAKPLMTRILLVLTLDKTNPNFDFLDAGLKERAEGKQNGGIRGIGLFVAHFAVLFVEGRGEAVMNCVDWLDKICISEKKIINEAYVLFFSDYRTYKLMPCFWSLRPKDFLEMQFEEGENEVTEENVAEQAFALYEKMILLSHKLHETNMEAQLDPTGLLSREFIRFAPDPRSLHVLLGAQQTKEVLFSLKEFNENFFGDFYSTISQDAFL